MKVNINKHLKLSLIIVVAIIIFIISFFVYKTVKHPGVKEEKVSIYSYDNKANIDYRVSLKPNILYEEKTIGEGSVYITEFVDDIKASFKYKFNGERPASIKGSYKIDAVIEGFVIEGEIVKTIWTKEFSLLPKATFDTKDKSFDIKEDIPIKFQEYNDFTENLIKDSKISSNVKLTVSMDVNLKAETDKGIIEEKISPSMIIPLNNNYFEIKGNLDQDKSGSIDETKKTEIPINKRIVTIYAIIIGLLLIVLIFLVFFTKAVTITDPFQKKLNKIFKTHGNRLVALNNEIAITCENYSVVKSIDDLVRIADEIGRPIMYRYSKDYKEISKFHTYDENQIYVLDLRDITIKSDENNSMKEDKKSIDYVAKLRKIIAGLKASKQEKEEPETEITKSQ